MSWSSFHNTHVEIWSCRGLQTRQAIGFQVAYLKAVGPVRNEEGIVKSRESLNSCVGKSDIIIQNEVINSCMRSE